MLDSFEDDWSIPILTQVRYLVPGVSGAGEDIPDPFFGGEVDIFFDWFAVFGLKLLAEDGVGEACAIAGAGYEGDVAVES